MKIKDFIIIDNNKIETCLLNQNNYISTENMLSNFGGIKPASSIPNGKCTKFDKNMILLSNIRPYFKKMWLSKFCGGCSSDVIAIKVNENICLSNFLYYRLSSEHFFDTYVKGCKGTKMPRGNKDVLLNYDILIPSIAEQQHIVNTIGSIDDLIEHKLLLLDKLEQLEKNLYLKECLNKDKFSLLDRLQFIKGKKPKNFTDNGIDYLTIDALENGNLTYTNDEKLVYCKTNDILMVMDGASSGKVYIGYNGVVGSTLAKIKTNINPYYLYIYLKNNYKNIREHNIGSAIPHTNKDIIYTLKISNNTISNEIYNFLLNTRINLNIEIIHLKSLKTSYLKKFFG